MKVGSLGQPAWTGRGGGGVGLAGLVMLGCALGGPSQADGDGGLSKWPCAR